MSRAIWANACMAHYLADNAAMPFCKSDAFLMMGPWVRQSIMEVVTLYT